MYHNPPTPNKDGSMTYWSCSKDERDRILREGFDRVDKLLNGLYFLYGHTREHIRMDMQKEHNESKAN